MTTPEIIKDLAERGVMDKRLWWHKRWNKLMPPEGPLTVVPFDDFAAELIAEAAAARWLEEAGYVVMTSQNRGGWCCWLTTKAYKYMDDSHWRTTRLESIHAAVVAVQNGEETP